MVDLQHVLQGAINRPAAYPPELIEQVPPCAGPRARAPLRC
jgi:hypothetical protein